jgi:hypothetical protein
VKDEVMHASGNVQGIKAALEGIRTLRVADYQRDYSWQPTQIDDLWADVQDLLDEGPSGEHFLGTLILQQNDESQQLSDYELVDGQQRLTTIFIFVSVLLDHAKLHPSSTLKLGGRTFNVAQELETFLLGQPDENNHRSYSRLIPLVFLQKIYRVITDISLERDERLKEAPRAAKKGDKAGPITLPLRRAYNHIEDKITAHLAGFTPTSDEHLEEVFRLQRVFFEQLKVLKLVTNDLSDSLDVFMTLNNRGTPLGVFDLFRGEILKERLSVSPTEVRDSLFLDSIGEWNQIMENLGGYSADKYLRHFALTKNYEKAKGEELIKAKPLTMKALPKWTTDYLQDKVDPGFAAEYLWNEAVQKSDDYGYMLAPRKGDFSDYYLEGLKLIGDSYRVLLLGVDFLNEDTWSNSDREALLRHTFSLFLRWTLANKNAQVLEGIFQNLSAQFSEGLGCKPLIREVEGREKFSFDLKSRLESDVDSAVSKAIMLVIEAHLSQGSIKINLNDVQLEHIAPQKSTPSWRSAIGAEVDYDLKCQRLGNLVALDSRLNAKIKQADFDKKQVEYKKSRLQTVQDLCVFESWGAAQVDSRTKWAADAIDKLLANSKIEHFSKWSENQ